MGRKKQPFYPLQEFNASADDLSEARSAGIEQEIELMRNIILQLRRSLATMPEPPSLDVKLAALRCSALASVVLTQLMRTRKLITMAGPTGQEYYEQVMAELRQSVAEGEKTRRLEEYLSTGMTDR